MARMIDPDRRFVELFLDELYWLKMTELAAEKGVIVDKLFNAVIEGFLFRVGKIQYDEVGDAPVKVEVTLEPIREDKPFFDSLVTIRDDNSRNKRIADTVSDLELDDMEWGEV